MVLCRKPMFILYLIAVAMGIALTAGVSAQEALRSSGWIAMSVADYQSLRSKAYPVEPETGKAGIAATLTRINYDLRVDGDLAIGQASLTIDVIEDGWVRVPIPVNLYVREAKLNGKLVSLIPIEKNSNIKLAVFAHQGRAELLLDIALPVTTTAVNESISLPPAIAGITRAVIQLPRQGIEIKLTGGFLAEKSEDTDKSQWVVYGRGNEALTFSWWRKSDDRRSSQPLRLRGSLTELVGLGEDTTSVQAEVNAEVFQGAAQEIKIRLPEKVAINHVTGAMIADWETKSGELVVKFLDPVEKTASFVINGETRTPRDGQIEIPLLRLLNAERETGGVAVEVLGAGEIKDQKSVGLDNADSTDLGGIVSSRQSPSLAAFRFQSGDAKVARSLSVNVARYTQEAVLMANIEEARYQILISEEGKSLVQARYAIRNNQRNFLKLTLPPGAVVWSASLSGKPIRPGQAPDGSLLLPLEKARAGEDAPTFAAEILYLSRGEKWNGSGKFKLSLPALDLPVSRTGLNYFYPPLFKVAIEPGLFRTQVYQNPTTTILGAGEGGGMGGGIGGGFGAGIGPYERKAGDLQADATKILVDEYRSQSYEGKRAGILPVKVTFPTFGPSIFLVSELTPENQSPIVEINYETDRKGGVG
jgi:hypothetical protein